MSVSPSLDVSIIFKCIQTAAKIDTKPNIQKVPDGPKVELLIITLMNRLIMNTVRYPKSPTAPMTTSTAISET